MRSSVLFVFASVAAWVAFTPVQCRAQADADPDQFETINVEPFDRFVQLTGTVIQQAADFRGTVTLPYSVSYAGMNLRPGTYFVSARSVSRTEVVTFTSKGRHAARMQVVVLSQSGAQGPSALVLDHEGKRRTLSAISLEKPGIIFHLRAARRNSNSSGTEIVPIYAALKTD